MSHAAFKRTVRNFYKKHGRHDLPWRQTTDPYQILVSEMMLQQTQVERVIPKYKAFLKKWPTAKKLSNASLSEVLTMWQGLGYNRRAKLLHACAKEVIATQRGSFPDSFEALKSLPGIGPYTAGAVLAFAFNKAVPLIETNVRTVYIHHFFSDQTDVTEADILSLVERTMDTKNPREWYWALMDYGSYIKKEYGNPNSRTRSYKKQAKFAGSDRQIRGRIIACLSKGRMTRTVLLKTLSQFEDIRVDAQLERLLVEGMIKKNAKSYSLPD